MQEDIQKSPVNEEADNAVTSSLAIVRRNDAFERSHP